MYTPLSATPKRVGNFCVFLVFIFPAAFHLSVCMSVNFKKCSFFFFFLVCETHNLYVCVRHHKFQCGYVSFLAFLLANIIVLVYVHISMNPLLFLNFLNLFIRFTNQFWSDLRFMSSYYKTTFRPRAALPHEVTLLIPNIFNTGETVPVNIPKSDLMNVYMTIFSHQIMESDVADEADDAVPYGQMTSGSTTIPPQWYV